MTSTVKKVTWDNNGTSAVGLAEVTAAVQAVTSPVQISLPVHDVAAGYVHRAPSLDVRPQPSLLAFTSKLDSSLTVPWSS